jgi:hypothetical protein
VALLKKWFGKRQEVAAAEGSEPANGGDLPQPELPPEQPEPLPENGAEPVAETDTGAVAKKKGLIRRFESNLRRKVDGYVDNKAVELLDDATKRAQQFRQETLDAVRGNAMELLDLTEQRIDEKLVEIEHMLEKRLQAELKMRLRALFWTLLFVLLMALVSLGYVWFKQQSGLQTANQAANNQAAE